MADVIGNILDSNAGKQLVSALGLPAPADLRRHTPGEPLAPGPVLVATVGGGTLGAAATELLGDADVEVHDLGAVDGGDDLGPALDEVLGAGDSASRVHALVLDVAGLSSVEDAGGIRAFLHDGVRRLAGSSRVVVLAAPVDPAEDPARVAAQQGVEGLVRSLAKELRAGGTANLVRVADGGDVGLPTTLRFLLSGRSAYVSGQVLDLDAPPAGALSASADPDRPHDGRVALVTGASRGIGAAIARVLARDGAHVVCLDLPSAGADLAAVANEVGGTTLQVDVTADDAGARVVEHLTERHGGVDVVVHNAGITRDKTMAGMDPGRWDAVVQVNLASQQRIDAALLDAGALNEPGGRIVSVASVSGIAGNRGQTNYALTKAGVIGRVAAMAPVLASRGATINAVAPGFIETEMTASMPFAVREVGRRINSLNQGGRPVDVAEAISFLASPGAGAVTGRTLRVCGQQLIGA